MKPKSLKSPLRLRFCFFLGPLLQAQVAPPPSAPIFQLTVQPAVSTATDARGVAVGADGSAFVLMGPLEDNRPILTSVVKVDTAGRIVASITYPNVLATAIATDSAGSVYITGWATAVQPTVPTKPVSCNLSGAATSGFSYDGAFVAKFDSSLANTLYSVCFAGGSVTPQGIAVGGDGSAYAAGYTSALALPVTPGAFETNLLAAGASGFVTKLDPTGGLVYSTLFGGSGDDRINAITVDDSGRAYLAASSTSFDLPASATTGGKSPKPASATIFRSQDGGATWQPAASGSPTIPPTILAWDPQDPSVVYASSPPAAPYGLGGGIYASHDGGSTWTQTGPYVGSQTLAVAPAPAAALYSIVGGAFFSPDILKSTDEGAHWNPMLPPTSIAAFLVDPGIASTLYYCTQDEYLELGGLWRSTDSGTTWSQIYGRGCTTLSADPNNGSTLYLTNSRYLTQGGLLQRLVQKSTDGGVTWTSLPLPQSIYDAAIQVVASNSSVLTIRLPE